MLLYRQMRPDGLDRRYELLDEDIALIQHLGLYHMLHIPEVGANQAMITTLIERWHSETRSFHLPTGEALITLEDVWRILHIPIVGAWVIFYCTNGIATLCELFECIERDLHMRGQYEICWDDYDYDDLIVVLSSIVARLLLPDRCSHGFPIGWGRVI